MKDLQEIRQDIDVIDEEIVNLYQKRMKLTDEVAEYKILNNRKVLDRQRELSKLERLGAMAESEFNRKAVCELFEQIMSVSRKKQYRLLNEHGKAEPLEFSCMERTDYSGARIVFQGLEGAYSELATKEYFGEDCDCYHVETWKDAMEAIKNHEADFAVLPIENSSAGIVSENYDLLVEYDNYIVGEQIIRIEHALLGLPEAQMEDITSVYSHPQSLMQCSTFLEEHRAWEKHSLKNNAFAAKKIRDDALLTQAAIASEQNADIYGLKVLKSSVQNNKNNSTRFLIVTDRKVYNPKANRISICFEIPHESGSLYHMLSHFIYNNLNMTNIQSRPLGERNWEYRFFVDFEGTFTDSAVQNALNGLKEEATHLRILGSY